MKTSKKLWIALGIVAVLFAGNALLSGYLFLCDTVDKVQIVSPDGYLTAEKYTIDCGARNSTKTYINLFKSVRTSAKEDDGETVVGIYNLHKDELELNWIATDTLRVVYKGDEAMKVAPSNKFGVKIVTRP